MLVCGVKVNLEHGNLLERHLAFES
jgi:hypothetical protein